VHASTGGQRCRWTNAPAARQRLEFQRRRSVAVACPTD